MSRPAARTDAREARPGPLGIGETLRRRRESLNVSLEQVHERIRIPVASLRALEEERFEVFAAAQYAKGFLRSYAAFLDLDPQPLLERLSTVVRADRKPELVARSGEVPIRPAAPPSPLRRVLRWAVAVLVVLFGVVAYVGYREIRAFYATPIPTPEPLAATPVPTVPQPVAAEPSPELPPPTPATVDGVRLVARAADVSWLRVVADGRRVFEGFIRPGESQVWEAQQTLNIVIGNASAVALEVNGRQMGTLGGPGEVVRRTFTIGEVAPVLP
ncbi:MAG: DUF4115 domain-containing protein [Armatimonadota bacterium]|nr:DUF4115 domain-containing protein [Armatimonadota bacterium]